MNKINIEEKLLSFSDHWNPRIIGELNGQYIKLAKFKGEFIWHKHENEDELFYVLEGSFNMEFREKTLKINKDELIIVPKGVEHKPAAENEVSVMLFEPKSTINTGDIINEMTRLNLEKV